MSLLAFLEVGEPLTFFLFVMTSRFMQEVDEPLTFLKVVMTSRFMQTLMFGCLQLL